MQTRHLFLLPVFFLLFINCEKNKFYLPPENSPEIEDGIYQSPNEAGTLTITNGIRHLALSGSNYEMGYAHGYLLAENIIYQMNHFTYWQAGNRDYTYEELKDHMTKVDWSGYETELEGMLDGLRTKLSSEERIIYPMGSSKEVELVDLQIMNSIPDWGCSSFSAWGDARIEGDVIYARNLDYHRGHEDAIKNGHVLISYDNGEGTRWAGASFCGFIGAISGMTENGMTAALHDTDQFSSTDDSNYISRCIIVRKVLENSQESWTPNDVQAYMDHLPAYTGLNLHVTFPTINRTDAEIAGVIEFDGNAEHEDGRASLRLSTDNANLPEIANQKQSLEYSNLLINTNHYLVRRDNERDEPWGGDSGARYISIAEDLEKAKQDGQITIGEALETMSGAGGINTIHTVIFEANAKRLHFYLAKPKLSSFESERLSYDFGELF